MHLKLRKKGQKQKPLILCYMEQYNILYFKVSLQKHQRVCYVEVNNSDFCVSAKCNKSFEVLYPYYNTFYTSNKSVDCLYTLISYFILSIYTVYSGR
jgi:uncharacterized protein YpbB